MDVDSVHAHIPLPRFSESTSLRNTVMYRRDSSASTAGRTPRARSRERARDFRRRGVGWGKALSPAADAAAAQPAFEGTDTERALALSPALSENSLYGCTTRA